MAKIINIINKPRLELDPNAISSHHIRKTFGRPEDNIELHIYDLNANLLYSEPIFTDYSLSKESLIPPSTPLYPTSVEPAIINPSIEGAGNRVHETPGPNQAEDGYWFNTGAEKVWVSNILQQPQGIQENLTSELNIDPIKVLIDKGYTTGKYNVKFNFQRNKIFNETGNPFFIKEISANRREIRTTTPEISNTILQ